MSREIYSSFRTINDVKVGGVSKTIFTAFGNPQPPKFPLKRESLIAKRLTNIKDVNKPKDFFLTEAEINEIENQMTSEIFSALTYEEMIKEVDLMRSRIKSKDTDIAELRKRLKKCQSEINIREAGFNGIDKSLHNLYQQADIKYLKRNKF